MKSLVSKFLLLSILLFLIVMALFLPVALTDLIFRVLRKIYQHLQRLFGIGSRKKASKTIKVHGDMCGTEVTSATSSEDGWREDNKEDRESDASGDSAGDLMSEPPLLEQNKEDLEAPSIPRIHSKTANYDGIPYTPVSSSSYCVRVNLYLIWTKARNLVGLVERVDESSTSKPGGNVVDTETESTVSTDVSGSQQDSQDVGRGRRSEEASSECCFEDGTIGVLSEAGNAASSVGEGSSTSSKSSSQDSIERGHQSNEQESFECSEEDGIVIDDDDDGLKDDLERLAYSVQAIQDEVALLHTISFECCSEDGSNVTGTDDDAYTSCSF
jgi:hypothetical protein